MRIFLLPLWIDVLRASSLGSSFALPKPAGAGKETVASSPTRLANCLNYFSSFFYYTTLNVGNYFPCRIQLMLYATSEVNRFHLKLGDYYVIKGCDIMEIALLLIFQCRPPRVQSCTILRINGYNLYASGRPHCLRPNI